MKQDVGFDGQGSSCVFMSIGSKVVYWRSESLLRMAAQEPRLSEV